MPAFTYATARSGSLLVGFALALGVETIGLHLLLALRHPVVFWALTVASVSTLAWLAADYRALGRGAVRLDEGRLDMAIGGRASVMVSLAKVIDVRRHTWRDLPATGMPAAASYMNLMKPASANVFLSLRVPVEVRLLGGIRRRVQHLGLCLDAPDLFVAAVQRALEERFQG